MDTAPGKLLVVVDNEANRDMLSRRLSRRGHEVALAEDGYQAIEMVKEQEFDVILLDTMMPGIDGLEVLQTLRRTHSAGKLPIILATAKDDSADIVQAMYGSIRAGAATRCRGSPRFRSPPPPGVSHETR